MPEGPEVETQDLQEHIQEAHNHHSESGDADAASWTRSIALSTAILAVFAAVGALQAGSLVNEALEKRIEASDKWSEYQASREKSHLYTVSLDALIDAGANPTAHMKEITLTPSSRNDRAGQYKAQIDKEDGKAKTLSDEATKLEKDSKKDLGRHLIFARQVALLQVAIALSAIAALTKVRWVWYASMAIGVIGIVLFAMGIL